MKEAHLIGDVALSDIMIIFNKNKAINMKSSNYKTLVTLISKHSYSAQATPSYLTFNSTGTSSGSRKRNLVQKPLNN